MVDMVLLGAGASKEAGVPTAFEMTQEVVEYFDRKADEDIMYRCCAQLLRNVDDQFGDFGASLRQGVPRHDGDILFGRSR